jgi:four helix bundle protein
MYDLEERTLMFSKKLLGYIKSVYITDINKNILNQVLRSWTSIGANYCEANGSSSKKDLANKIFICKKESKETVYWLKLLLTITSNSPNQLEAIAKEAEEIACIFNKISRTMSNKTTSKSPVSKFSQ